MNNKIEKLSYEELIKSLECCTAPTQECGQCPANKYEPGECFDSVKIQAAEMLKDFKVEIERLQNSITYCKECKKYELMTSNNRFFCDEFGGYVTENDFCSRGTPCRNGG